MEAIVIVFEATAREVGRSTVTSEIHTDVGVWTDGIGLFSDNEPPCAFPLQPGAVYRVTVERVTAHE